MTRLKMFSQNYVFLLAFLIVGCALTVHSYALEGRVEPFTSKEMQEFFQNSTSGCGILRMPVESLYDPDLNETTSQDLKCAVACVIKNLGLITDKFEFNIEGFKNFIELLPDSTKSSEDDDEDQMCDIGEFEDKCITIKGDNECDVGWEIFNCFQDVCEPKEETKSNEVKDNSAN